MLFRSCKLEKKGFPRRFRNDPPDERCWVYLREERPLVAFELQAVNDEPLHGLGGGTVHLTEVWGQVATPDHEEDLSGTKKEEGEWVTVFFSYLFILFAAALEGSKKTLPGLCC